MKSKMKKLAAIAATVAIAVSQIVVSASADGETSVRYVFESIPEKNITQSDVSYSIYGNTTYTNGELAISAQNGGGGFTFGTDAQELAKEYPVVIEERFTVGESGGNNWNAVAIRGASENSSQEVIGFQPSTPKWRMLKWTKTINESYAGQTYTVRVVADVKNDTISAEVSVDGDDTEYTADASLSSLYSDCANGIKLIQIYGSKDSVIHYAKIGYLAVAPKVSGDVMFGNEAYVAGEPVSRETTQIKIPFDYPMDENSFAGQVTLESDAGATISVNGAYDSTTKSLTITNGRLRKNTDYTLTIGTGVTNSLGTAMAAPYTLEFTTDNSGETLMPSITIDTAALQVDEGDRIEITASTSGGEGDVSKVEYYDNSVLVNTSDTFPYSYTIASISGGNHRITAVVTNTDGDTAQSNSLDISAAKYITEPIFEGVSSGESKNVMADKIVIENTVTINNTLDNSLTGRVKAGDKYFNLWTIYKALGSNLGISFQVGDTATIKSIVDTIEGKCYVYCNGIIVDTLTQTNDLFKQGIVRFDLNGASQSNYSSHFKVTAMNYAVMPRNLEFEKNGLGVRYGLADADTIKVAFNKTLTADAFASADVTLKDSDNNVISCSGEAAEGRYVLRPTSVLVGGKTYTITFSGVSGMKEAESISFEAVNGFEISTCVFESDGSASAIITNNTDSSQEYVIAAINDGNRMVNVGFKKGTIAANTSESVSWTVEGYTKRNNETVKFMLWNSFENIYPLCAAVLK